MFYIGDPNQQPDISHPMRWNYMLPGIFPVSEMVQERRLENGKIYGLCWDYAAIFNAIANYYGLEARVTANKVYISDFNPSIDKSTANGMGPEEFEAPQHRLPITRPLGRFKDRHNLSRTTPKVTSTVIAPNIPTNLSKTSTTTPHLNLRISGPAHL